MPESFVVDLYHQGKKLEVSCYLRQSRYTYQFLCQLNEAEIILEKDDEGNFRALDSDPYSSHKPNPLLVRALIEEMERILL